MQPVPAPAPEPERAARTAMPAWSAPPVRWLQPGEQRPRPQAPAPAPHGCARARVAWPAARAAEAHHPAAATHPAELDPLVPVARRQRREAGLGGQAGPLLAALRACLYFHGLRGHRLLQGLGRIPPGHFGHGVCWGWLGVAGGGGGVCGAPRPHGRSLCRARECPKLSCPFLSPGPAPWPCPRPREQRSATQRSGARRSAVAGPPPQQPPTWPSTSALPAATGWAGRLVAG